MQAASNHSGAFLLVYLIHSTLLLGGVWLVLHVWRQAAPRYRDLLWKFALFGGLCTTLGQFLLPLPHVGAELVFRPGDSSSETATPELANPAAIMDQSHSFSANSAGEQSDEQRSAGELARPSATKRGPEPFSDDALSTEEHSQSKKTPDPSVDRASSFAAFVLPALVAVWLFGSAVAIARIGVGLWFLWRLQRSSRVVTDGLLRNLVTTVARKAGVRVHVSIHLTANNEGPMVAGMLRWRLFLPSRLLAELDDNQLETLLTHEMAHLARRDPWWNVLAALMCGVFFLQPLNRYARRQLRIQAEYLADHAVVQLSADGARLARCLTTLAEWTLRCPSRPVPARHIAAGMATFRSLLGKRVERLLAATQPQTSKRATTACVCAILIALLAIPVAAPRAFGNARPALEQNSRNTGEETMNFPRGKTLASMFVALGLALPANAENEPAANAEGELKTVPDELHSFSGRVIGRLVSKDTEKGELTLQIKKVDRVWRGNKAKNPQSAEGRTLKIEGVSGKFLDVLLTLKEGDGVRIEVKHVSGDNLRFLGEGLEKVSLEPSQNDKDDERPTEPTTGDNSAPAGLNGFRGIMVGKVVSKDVEQGVLVFQMEKVTRVWKQNKAPKPELSVGKPLTVEGISGKFLDVLLVLEPGDRVEVEAFHNRGSNLHFPGEWLKKVE